MCNAARLQGRAEQACQPSATWQPFVVKVVLHSSRGPDVVAVSNYTWCSSRQQQTVIEQVLSDAAELTNNKLIRVKGGHQALVMALSSQTQALAGGRFQILDEKGKNKPDALLTGI